MTPSAPRRRLLPLLGVGGGRSPKTCEYRCGNACFHPAPNKSDNAYFGDVFQGVLSRRTALKGAAVGAGTGALGLAALSPAAAERGPDRPHPSPRPTFKSVQPNNLDRVSVPNGYDHHVIIRWGDPVLPGAPEFDFENQTAEAQAQQFGYNCDYVGFFTLDDDHGLLWVNHEYTNESLMFAGYSGGGDADLEQIRVAMAAHGGSVVELERVYGTGQWVLSEGDRSFNRRITPQTPFRVAGPAADHFAPSGGVVSVLPGSVTRTVTDVTQIGVSAGPVVEGTVDATTDAVIQSYAPGPTSVPPVANGRVRTS